MKARGLEDPGHRALGNPNLVGDGVVGPALPAERFRLLLKRPRGASWASSWPGASVQETSFPFLPVAPEPLIGGSWANPLGFSCVPYRQAFVDNAEHKDAPCLVGESRVLVAVRWSPSSRAQSHAFTGTRVWGSSEQRVGKLHLGLLGLELLVLFDRLVFGSKELLPSKTEMIVVALIFLWLIWKEDDTEKVNPV